MDTQISDLANLSISDLESLLAEKRRHEGKRVLRSIAGYTPGELPSPRLAPRPVSPAPTDSQPRKGKPTRRLHVEETRLLVGGQAAAQPRAWTHVPAVPADRFRRSGLAAPPNLRPQRGPAWMRQANVRKSIDRSLWVAEVGFCLLLFYVFGQWVYTDFLSTDNLTADMTAPPAASQPAQTAAPAKPRSAVVAVAPATAHSAAATLGGSDAHTATTTSPIAGQAAQATDVGQAPDEADNVIRYHNNSVGIPAGPPLLTATGTLTGTGGVPAVPPGVVASDPALPTEVRIPKINLDARVREVTVRLDTWEWEVADFMAGHHTGTANPGDTGNVVIAGHRDIRGSVFLHLDKLKKGDDIFVYNGLGTFHYIVRKSLIIKPTQVEVMAPTTDHRLTLITCTPVHIATSRLIVIADLDPNYVAPARGH
ncbi:MAG: sortase [Chloroflexia bacterium]